MGGGTAIFPISSTCVVVRKLISTVDSRMSGLVLGPSAVCWESTAHGPCCFWRNPTHMISEVPTISFNLISKYKNIIFSSNSFCQWTFGKCLFCQGNVVCNEEVISKKKKKRLICFEIIRKPLRVSVKNQPVVFFHFLFFDKYTYMHTASDCSSRGLIPRQMCRPVEQNRNLRKRCQQSRPPGLLQGTTDTQRTEMSTGGAKAMEDTGGNLNSYLKRKSIPRRWSMWPQSHEPLKRRESIMSSLGSLEI